MITSVHALRGLAALAVVFAHSNYLLFGYINSQFQAVSIFFVISGFIVAYITEKGVEGFIVRRAFRILPVYWLLTIFAVIWYSLGQFQFLGLLISNPYQAYMQVLSLLQTPGIAEIIIKSIFLIPYRDAYSSEYTVFLNVGWTLTIECFFYALFAALSYGGRVFSIIICSVVFLSFNAIRAYTGYAGVLEHYGKIESIYIPFGFAVYYIWKFTSTRFELGRVKYPIVLFAFLIGVVLIMCNVKPFGYYVGILIPAFVVLAALMLHSAGVEFRWRPLIFLGDISYALYLVHTIVLTSLRKYAEEYSVLRPETFVGLLITVAVSCFVAWLLHIFIELPVIKAGKRFVPSPRRVQASEPPHNAPDDAMKTTARVQ